MGSIPLLGGLAISRSKTLRDNKWRYIIMAFGFFLLLAPFSLLGYTVFAITGSMAVPDLHTFCYRMPIDWLFGGRVYMLFGSVAAMFILGVVLIAAFVGPVFCGWLCPVGSLSEGLSRSVPLKDENRMKIKDTKVTAGLRYGFLLGFITVAALVGYKIASDSLSSVCCRYCTSSVMQNMFSAAFVDPSALGYWFTGSIIVVLAWLVIGGIFFVGGRGWCLFFCPLGAISGLAHKGGARLGLWKVSQDKTKCKDCASCQVTCPMEAINPEGEVARTLCISCLECTKSCPQKVYSYGRKKKEDEKGAS
jgi:ferredoxin-type protein NapH